MIKSLNDARLTDGLPRIVSGQDWVIALSESWARLHEKTLAYADGSQIYTSLDTVSETILDALAINWKIDWYDTGFSVDQKRRIVQACFESRRVMGTVRAVRLQAQAIYPGTEVMEWFDIGAEPGTFDLNIYVLPTDADIKQFFNAINYTKNVRSHLRRMMVYLSGDLDGPDILDGRTGKDPFGIETHYFVKYFGFISSEDIQGLRIPKVKVSMRIPFWGDVWHNGAVLHDGTIVHGRGRRYNLIFRTRWRYGVQTENNIALNRYGIKTGWKTEEGVRTSQKFFMDMRFTPNIESVAAGFKMETAVEEEIGTVTMTRRTKDVYFHNGVHRHNGLPKHKTIYEKEVIA